MPALSSSHARECDVMLPGHLSLLASCQPKRRSGLRLPFVLVTPFNSLVAARPFVCLLSYVLLSLSGIHCLHLLPSLLLLLFFSVRYGPTSNVTGFLLDCSFSVPFPHSCLILVFPWSSFFQFVFLSSSSFQFFLFFFLSHNIALVLEEPPPISPAIGESS